MNNWAQEWDDTYADGVGVDSDGPWQVQKGKEKGGKSDGKGSKGSKASAAVASLGGDQHITSKGPY